MPAVDPRGPREGLYKVIRGGDWHSFHCRRLTNRGLLIPQNNRNLVGFRCARSAKENRDPSILKFEARNSKQTQMIKIKMIP